MNNTITGILLALFLLSLGYAVYLKNFKVADLEKQITDYENTPPKIETRYLPGRVDTVMQYDTLTVREPAVSNPTLTSDVEEPVKRYTSTFKDTVISGTIYSTVMGDGYLESTNFKYRFTRPIYFKQRVDTLMVTETSTIVKFRPEPRPWRMQVGLFGGASPNPDMQVYLGPTAGVLTPKDNWIGYSYDVLNDAHLVSYRTTIRFDFLKKIKLNPFK